MGHFARGELFPFINGLLQNNNSPGVVPPRTIQYYTIEVAGGQVTLSLNRSDFIRNVEDDFVDLISLYRPLPYRVTAFWSELSAMGSRGQESSGETANPNNVPWDVFIRSPRLMQGLGLRISPLR